MKPTKKKAEAKVAETGVWAELKLALNEKEHNEIKFLNAEEDEFELMKQSLPPVHQPMAPSPGARRGGIR